MVLLPCGVQAVCLLLVCAVIHYRGNYMTITRGIAIVVCTAVVVSLMLWSMAPQEIGPLWVSMGVAALAMISLMARFGMSESNRNYVAELALVGLTPWYMMGLWWSVVCAVVMLVSLAVAQGVRRRRACRAVGKSASTPTRVLKRSLTPDQQEYFAALMMRSTAKTAGLAFAAYFLIYSVCTIFHM